MSEYKIEINTRGEKETIIIGVGKLQKTKKDVLYVVERMGKNKNAPNGLRRLAYFTEYGSAEYFRKILRKIFKEYLLQDERYPTKIAYKETQKDEEEL